MGHDRVTRESSELESWRERLSKQERERERSERGGEKERGEMRERGEKRQKGENKRRVTNGGKEKWCRGRGRKNVLILVKQYVDTA